MTGDCWCIEEQSQLTGTWDLLILCISAGHDVEDHSSLHVALIFQTVQWQGEHMELLALVINLTREPGLVGGQKR